MKTIFVLAALMCAATAAASTTATGVSRLSNPAISVNALFLGQINDDTPTADENSVKLQETEIQISSVVDPFWTADLVFAFHPAHAHEHEGEEEGAEGLVTDLEVAAIRSTGLPSGLGLTLGKFYAPFGKHAILHTHQYRFTRAPIALRSFLGDHGLTDVGARVDYTVGLPWWSELSVYGQNGDAEIFDAESRDLSWGAHWSNLWDVSEGGTLEVGASWLQGPQMTEEGPGKLNIGGADLTWKWISPHRSHGRAYEITAEWIAPDAEHEEIDSDGWFVQGQTRVSRNWWLGVGYGRANGVEAHDHEGMEEGDEHEFADWREWSAALTFAPSEFSALRAEISQLEEVDGERSDLRFSLQWNFTIGSHPAHLY